ncbi:MAG: hypothetical protein S4CHLAM7_07480 [Chlamydiae bacterium]|nr:hypothetical protein [Chlamydiota bacterium]
MQLSKQYISTLFALKRAKKVFHRLKEKLHQKRHSLATSTYDSLKNQLLDLNSAIETKNISLANELSIKAIQDSKLHLKSSFKDYFNEWVLGTGAILLIVSVVNQLWFQNYQIPSGSMRPTLMEKDRLIATKTNFGINVPFKKGHLFFNPNQLKRGNLVILQNDKLPKHENTSRYLYIFPAQKQFVKRLIGKPGDTLYFYGGKIYGIDKNGNDITEFLSSETFEPLEHIPFNTFEGKIVTDPISERGQIHSPVYLYQMNQLVGRLSLNSLGSFQGKFYNGSQWVDESPNLAYQNLWGIRNYAMTRLLSKEEALKLGTLDREINTPYILELQHSPQLNFPKPHLGMDIQGRLRPKLTLEKSFLPLDEKSLINIKGALSTSRFVVKDGFAGNYAIEKKFEPNDYSPRFEGVPDGTYEFIKGIGYKVQSSGVQVPLDKDHPINSKSPEMIQKLFNLGMQMYTLYEPSSKYPDFIPSRYAYFRDGDFYLMGQPVLEAENPTLAAFLNHEKSKTHGFLDQGAPLLPNGQINKEIVLNYGLSIPQGEYLFLGDNHANSRDCRSWGFIPEKNIQGSPAFTFWPLSKRIGPILQNHLTLFNIPTLLISFLGISLITLSIKLNRRQKKRKL